MATATTPTSFQNGYRCNFLLVTLDSTTTDNYHLYHRNCTVLSTDYLVCPIRLSCYLTAQSRCHTIHIAVVGGTCYFFELCVFSHPVSAVVKNKQSSTSTPSICLNFLYRNNFTFRSCPRLCRTHVQVWKLKNQVLMTCTPHMYIASCNYKLRLLENAFLLLLIAVIYELTSLACWNVTEMKHI
jgi:hypothetical protein